MAHRDQDEPFDASPTRKVSMPMATFATVLITCCGASFWASQVYRDIGALKDDAAEIKMRLARIEQRMAVNSFNPSLTSNDNRLLRP